MSAYIDLVFLGLVVVLIALRLNSVLGTKPQKPIVRINSKKDFDDYYRKMQKEYKRKIRNGMQDNLFPITYTPLALRMIPNFNQTLFITRAVKAFEMLLTAFANRDKETIKMLTSPQLYQKFSDIIDDRCKQNISAETDLIKINEILIQSAQISKEAKATIVVKFISDQINVLKNEKGEVIEGDENFVQHITDIWTFEKDINNSSPVWLLTSTKKK